MNNLLLSFGNQIEIIKLIHSEREIEQLTKERTIQILFTTIPLNNVYDQFSTIEISPFNLSSKYDTILNTISNIQIKYNNYKLDANFHTFFEPDLFIANPEFTSKTQIISYLCAKLEAKEYVDPNFKELVIKRENAATTGFGKIAIPHPANMAAIKTCVAVAISKKGFQWDTNTVHLVLLLAINKADRRTFRPLYESLISIFSDDNILQEVRHCTTFKQFESLIYRNMH